MTKFDKALFDSDGMYVFYGAERKFVARFKHKPGSKGSFITFLMKNFTVEEYFARMDAKEAPLTILQSKGYILPHIKTWLKRGGYEVSQAGYKQYVQDDMNRRKEATK